MSERVRIGILFFLVGPMFHRQLEGNIIVAICIPENSAQEGCSLMGFRTKCMRRYIDMNLVEAEAA